MRGFFISPVLFIVLNIIVNRLFYANGDLVDKYVIRKKNSTYFYSLVDYNATRHYEWIIEAPVGMALTLEFFDTWSSTYSVYSCLSEDCADITELEQNNVEIYFWSSTGYMLVSVTVSEGGQFTAQVSPSCPKIGYFPNKAGDCQRCKSCDPNAYTPNATCDGGSLQDFSGFCECNYDYLGTGYRCWRCLPVCLYYSLCTLNNMSIPTCTCPSGNYGDGYTCKYCSTCSSSSTSPGATCADGSTTDIVCQCSARMYGDGKSCYPCENTCGPMSTTPGALCPQGSLTDTPVCACESGYYGDGMQCTKCSVCDSNANKTGSCAGSSDVACACNIGYYGDGLTCTILPTTPQWIVDLAIIFGVLVFVGSLVAMRLGLVGWIARFEYEAQFKSASKLKFRIAMCALLGVCVLLVPLFIAIVNLSGAYQSTCSRPFDQEDASALQISCMIFLVIALVVSLCISCHSNLRHTGSCWGKVSRFCRPNCINCHPNPLQICFCWGKVSRFCRPNIGTLSFLVTVSSFAVAEILFFFIGMTCWKQLDVLPIHSAALGLFVLCSVSYDCFIICCRFRRTKRTLQIEIKPERSSSLSLQRGFRLIKSLTSSENVLLVRTVLLLVVTVISVAELTSTNYGSALSSCQAGWEKIFQDRGMQTGEFFQTSDAKFFCSTPKLAPNCTSLSVLKIMVGSNCTVHGYVFSNKVFLTVTNTSTSTSDTSNEVKLIYGGITYNVTNLEPFLLASAESQGAESSSSSSIPGVSNSDLFQSNMNHSYNLGACKQVSMQPVILWVTQTAPSYLDASFGEWNSTYSPLCPYSYQCQIDSQSQSSSTCSSSIQLSKWYYLNAYVSCDDIMFNNLPVETVYLTSGNIGLNLLPSIFSLIALWRTRLWVKASDGTLQVVNSNWYVTGSSELKAACTLSAYMVMEMAGVPEFSGGLTLKIVALALHTLHAILFAVVLGWAVPDIIRWESEVFLFVVVYSWYDLRMVMLAAKARVQHFKPRDEVKGNSNAGDLPSQEEMKDPENLNKLSDTGASQQDSQAGASEAGAPGGDDKDVYIVHFAQKELAARLFVETETWTCEEHCWSAQENCWFQPTVVTVTLGLLESRTLGFEQPESNVLGQIVSDGAALTALKNGAPASDQSDMFRPMKWGSDGAQIFCI